MADGPAATPAPAPQGRLSLQRILAGCGVVVAVGLSLWLTSRAWGPRPPAGDDVQGHLVRATWGLHHAVLALRLDSWFPRFMAGHQEFLMYGPGFDWAMALVRAATFGQLSDAGAMKVLQILACASLAPAAYYLASSFGFSRRASAAAAVLVLAVNSPFGLGYRSAFTIGLVPEQFAGPFCLVAFGGLWRVVTRRPATRRDIAVAVAFCSILVVTHPISVLVLAVMFPLAAVPRLLTLRLDAFQLGRLVVVGVAIGGLTAFWVLPFLAHRNLRGPVATWSTPTLAQQLGDIWSGHLLFGKVMGALVVAAVGLTILLATQSPFLRAPAEASWAALGYLLVAHADIHLQPHSDQALLLANRGLGYAGALGVLALAWWLATGADRVEEALRTLRPTWAPVAEVTAFVAVLAFCSYIVVVPLHGRAVAGQAPRAVPAMGAAAAALTRLVPPRGRFAVERDFPAEIGRTGVTQPNLWLANHTSRDELNVFNGESTASAGVGYLPDQIHGGDPDTVADRLSAVGTTELVTVDPATARRYADSPRWTLEWSAGPLAILRVTPAAGQPDPATLVSATGAVDARWRSTSVEHPRWTITPQSATRVTVAIADLPKWHARIDGRTVPITPTAGFHLISIFVPPGAHELTLDYRPDRFDWVGRGITALTVITLGAFFVTDRRRRAAAPTTAPPSTTEPAETLEPAALP